MSKQRLYLLILLFLASSLTAAAETVTLDGKGPGSTFDGLGGLSAGAGTRLLFDYPEPQRSQVLDLLFKPNFGASLHHLKVEIGGDVNSTEGSEPSYATTREEFEHPKPEYFNRGYEWWLMREAKKRNPKILLDILQWGAPDWIGDKDFLDAGDPNLLVTAQQRGPRNRKKFFTQDNADFIVGFIQGAKKYHDLDIDFCGVWNEDGYDVPWIKLLRKTLDRRSLAAVGITADDGIYWRFAEEVARDPELRNAVHALGNHYSGSQSTATAKQLGKLLWASEDHTGWRPGWQGACDLAKLYNRNYIDGRITKTIICYLIAAYYDTLPFPNCGTIRANSPWSGHYDVWPAHWAFAHTTQFAQPGWKYLDAGCGTLQQGGSYVTLRSPDAAGDFSIILETGEAKTQQELTFKVNGGLAAGPLHVWRSNEQRQFEQVDDISPIDGAFTITLQPSSIYSLTTTTGQKKGTPEIPPDTEFPYPYQDDFESYSAGNMPKYFFDQSGTFEVAARPDGGKCLRQTVARHGIDWNATQEPYTVLGSKKWYNYEVSCDANVERSGYAAIFGRIRKCLMGTIEPPQGYWLKVSTDGRWELKSFNVTLKSGTVSFAAERWHKLAMKFSGSHIAAAIDGVEIVAFEEDKPYFEPGIVGLGTGWNNALFDNFLVHEIPGPSLPVNLAAGKTASASSTYPAYDARLALDGDPSTRWNSAVGNDDGSWLEVDFGIPTRFDRVIVQQMDKRIDKYKIQYLDGAQWKDAFEGEAKDDFLDIRFKAVAAAKMRLFIETTKNHITPSVYELGVFDDHDAGLRIAMCQTEIVDGDLAENMHRAEKAIREAAKQHADLACLPEAADWGWLYEHARRDAFPIPGQYTDHLSKIAAELKIWVCAGCLEKDGSKTYNSAVLIDRTGKIVLKHRKTNILKFLSEMLYDPGVEEDIKVVDTELGRVGVTICADNFDRQIPKKVADLGAWLLITPHGFAAEEKDLEKNAADFQKHIKGIAEHTGMWVIGTNTCLGPIKAGAWKGRPHSGCSTLARPDGSAAVVAKFNVPDLIVFTIPSDKRENVQSVERPVRSP